MSRSRKHEPHVMHTACFGRHQTRWYRRYRRHVDRMRARQALARGDHDTPRHDLGWHVAFYEPGDGKGWHQFRDRRFYQRRGGLVWITAAEQLAKARRK